MLEDVKKLSELKEIERVIKERNINDVFVQIIKNSVRSSKRECPHQYSVKTSVPNFGGMKGDPLFYEEKEIFITKFSVRITGKSDYFYVDELCVNCLLENFIL